MRTRSAGLVSLLVVAVVVAGTTQADVNERHHVKVEGENISFKSFSTFEADEVRFHLGKGEIVITHLEEPFEEIRITSDQRMYLDDEEVPLTPQQQEVVAEFYQVSYDIRGEAKAIAKEGVKIGLKGAKLGLQAVGAAMKMIFTEYDEDQFERDMDREAEKLEAEGERLEERADQLEEMVDRWAELGIQMKHDIEPLQGMDWL